MKLAEPDNSWETAELVEPQLPAPIEQKKFSDEDQQDTSPVPIKITPKITTAVVAHVKSTAPSKKKKESKREKRAKRLTEKALEEQKRKLSEPSPLLPPAEEKKQDPAGTVLIIIPLTLPGDEKILYSRVFSRLSKDQCDVRLLDSNKINKEAAKLYPEKKMLYRRTGYYYKYFRAEMTKYLTDPLTSGKVRIVFVDKIHPPESLEKSLA